MQNRIVHDEELVVRLQRGDEWVFQLLVRRFREKVFSTAFGLTLDKQESLKIFKEVFQDIYDGAGSVEGDISLNELVHRITVQRCLHRKKNWFRRFKHGNVRVDEDAPRSTDDIGESFVDTSIPVNPIQIKNMMRLLPEVSRTVYVLREAQKLSYEEIANVLGIRPATARTKMLYARKKLYELLQPEKVG